MKTLHLNLAARPYRDYRPLYAVVVAASLLIAFLMLNNVDTYYRYVRETRATRNEIARIERQAGQERSRAEVATGEIRKMDLATLGRQSRFVNAQLAERAFSWSELLDRLEAVVPRDVRINSIAPSFSDNGFVHLTLSCEAKTTDGMLATITRFQSNNHFVNPFPTTENRTGSTFHFGLGVDYKPSIPRVVTK
ncbi:MAG: hypothetical protein JJE51_00140 [Thermoanaerobaculia bacterium]|nr:hypothetical protein [Thermoanaerobaculia bacterium]